MVDETRIGIGNDNGLVHFERIEVREVSGKGEITLSPPPNRKIDLMRQVDVTKDAVKGEWELKDSQLISRPFKTAKFELPYRPPEEYDFHVAFTRLNGDESVPIMLAKNGRSFIWDMGGYENSRWGFYHGPGRHAASLERRIETGRLYEVIVKVRNDAVRAFVDGALAVEWPTDYQEFHLDRYWRLRDRSRLGIGNDNGLVQFERLEVREVTGKGKITRTPLPQGPIDLLPFVDVSKDAIKGEWELTDSKLVSRPFTAANLQLPYRPPEEYDFHVTFSRQSGAKSVEMILSKNERSFVWSMGGFDNTRQGFYFAGQIGPKHDASLARGIESERIYEVIVQVRNDVVRSFVDGELAVEWPTDYKNFRLSSNWALKDETRIGVGNDEGLVHFKQIEVREVTGKGEFIRPTR